MPWNFQHLESRAQEIAARGFFDKKIRFCRINFEFEPEAAEKFPVGNHRRGKRVTPNWATKLPLYPGNILHVIDVPMGQKQKFEIDTERLHPFTGTLRCVEKNPAVGRLKQVTIRFKNATAELPVIHRILIVPGDCTGIWLQLKPGAFTNI